MAPLDETSGPLRMVASFDRPESAREAMISLEGLGLDAEAVRLLDQDPQVQVGGLDRSGEMDAAQSVAGNYLKGALVTAVVVGGIAAVVVLILGVRPRPLALGLSLLGGGLAGFFLGGYLNAARKLPVNVDALDTFTVDSAESAPVRVEVRLTDPSLFDRAASVCRDNDATGIDRAPH